MGGGLIFSCLASVFFLSQFVTSLLWASIAQKHGRRAVLLASLLGNALSLTLFGASTSTGMAICVRLCQGIFAGAVGVARGAVRDITDPTNEARAYTLVGLSWGLGMCKLFICGNKSMLIPNVQAVSWAQSLAA